MVQVAIQEPKLTVNIELLEPKNGVWLSPDGDMHVAGEESRFTFPGSWSAQYLHHWFSTHASTHFCDEKMPLNSLPNPFEDFPPPAIPYLPSFEEATAFGGGTLRLPTYRASYIRRYHPYIRWTRAPPRIVSLNFHDVFGVSSVLTSQQVYYTVNPRLTIAELVQSQQHGEVAGAAARLEADMLRVVQSQLQILVKDAINDSGELERHNEDSK
ncbi:hypothetical protein DL96DRAFT_1756114 [Flagelloscypha sp. PMI_526]|nr:hypothetical protein DL96DRAFT_1756114 [Flagelloscypha sp. PMI_526]